MKVDDPRRASGRSEPVTIIRGRVGDLSLAFAASQLLPRGHITYWVDDHHRGRHRSDCPASWCSSVRQGKVGDDDLAVAFEDSRRLSM